MSDIEEMKRVKVKSKFKCDVCLEKKDDEELRSSFKPKDSSKIDICRTCHHNLPSDLIHALQTGKPTWKSNDARTILFSIRESEDAFDYSRFEILNMNQGVWAVFGNGEAELYELEKLGDIKHLESTAKDREFNYRGYPMYLMGVLDNGKLKQFKAEWKLVEVKEEDND